jgi:HSP20 family molecular chaperone IbpA
MSRYYSDSDDDYSNHRRHSESTRASGWQSPPVISSNKIPSQSSSSSPNTRIIVDSPFGSNKCDYSIDKSQPGRIIVTARRLRTDSSKHRSSRDKDHVAVQRFDIPLDADVDYLQSHVERHTNRLIIDIPHQQRASSRPSRSSYTNSSSMARNLIRSPDVERMLTSPTGGPQLVRETKTSGKQNSGSGRKLEYRVDCHGYAADELEVFIQHRDLIVQGQTRKSSSGDPKQQRVSKKFTRKITLPNTVDLPGVLSYLENGELRVEAPLKRGVYYSDEEIIIPGPPPSSINNRATAALITNLEKRVRSPPLAPSSSSNSRHHYRRNERTGRRRDYNRDDRRQVSSPTRRVRSVDGLRYPLYVSPRELDEDEYEANNVDARDSRHQANGNSERQFTHRKQTEFKPTYRSIYSPTKNLVSTNTTSTKTRQQNYPSDDDSYLRF